MNIFNNKYKLFTSIKFMDMIFNVLFELFFEKNLLWLWERQNKPE